MILLRIKSHRAYDKIKKSGIQAKPMFSFTEGYFYEIPESDLNEALKIKGVSKAGKPKSNISECWGTSKASL
jgi:hypothetical protein